MIKKLSRMKLVEYRPYHGVKLTPKGKGIALEILRHHRLVESYLAEALGVPWDQVDAEAEKLEHVLSDDLEARMDAFLGHPKIDPHGAPIPTVNGHIPSSASRRLTDLAPGQSAVIASVSDHDPEMLRYFAEIGIALKRELQVVDIASLEGRITLRLGGENLVLGCEVAQYIFVDEVG
jgi:DtxR family Mn-dependent transcriptional regulator